ncbi:pilus assembly protein TadG-related protein [Bradyrhizobium sp. OAE829]|uniref:pilus assembly protein TadG-related protein n=1 Tax=Bradyrhizobium sp. OAE829 TaxID=2663807 RepID=UPI00178B7B03
MRNLLRCRRGSVAFATVIALVPLIGVVALGAEAGFWYVLKQNAQNAADAAAYSGGLKVACSNSGSGNCDSNNAYDYIYRGKQFADKNKFCDPRDQTYPCVSSPPTGATQTVAIDQPTSTRVRAIVAQQQPTYLAAVLGMSTVNIGATAIVEVQKPKEVCTLGLGRYPPNNGSLNIAGNSQITGNGCALMSNDAVMMSSAPSFTGSGWAINSASGCKGGHCDDNGLPPHNYAALPADNPLKALDTASFNTFPTLSGNSNAASVSCAGLSPAAPVGATRCYSVSPNTASTAYGNMPNNADYVVFTGGSTTATYYFKSGFTFSSSVKVSFAQGIYYFSGAFGGNVTLDFAPGTYFFNASAITLGGNVTCSTCTSWTGTGLGTTFVLLGDSKLTISGNVSLSAPVTNNVSSLLNGVLFDDQAPNKSNNAVSISGGTASLGGTMYFPNVDVTWGGSVQSANTTCAAMIANTVTLSGNAYVSSSNCNSSTIFKTQIIALVQ